MSKYKICEKTSCVTLFVPPDEVPSWISVFTERYAEFLQRVDGFLVELKSEDGTNKTVYSILDHRLNPKKPILTITIFSNGTIMAQGNAFMKWKVTDLDNIIRIIELKESPDFEITSFIDSLRKPENLNYNQSDQNPRNLSTEKTMPEHVTKKPNQM